MDTPAHFSQAMPGQDTHYQQQQHGQQQQQQQQSWTNAPHLITTTHNGSPFQSPAPSTSQLDQSYSGFFHGRPAQPSLGDAPALDRTSSLSLNISSLSVTSPTNASPITPSPIPSTTSTAISPVTPLSPSSTPQQNIFPQNSQRPGSHHMFAFVPPQEQLRYDHGHYDVQMHHRSTTSSRSSSASDKSIPRKRSFTGNMHPLPVSMEEGVFDAGSEMTPSYEEMDMAYGVDSQGSPVEGSSSGGDDDPFKPLTAGGTGDSSHSVGLLTKASGTNNFVTKLYQMISDPKASSFITWNEHGSSFVVQNVGEFSRTILGSHFKHSNFSSFVRQLNMYGFHKINRNWQTPRAQRTSTESQTWEFSHSRFLRDRPDLLDEIKRKALEPDPSMKHRVELPGEIASQLNQMREQNRKTTRALDVERAKVERLTNVTKALYDVVQKAFPGTLPHFPPDMWDVGENPPIYVTSPPSSMPVSRYPPIPSSAFHNLHSFSPNSSPTANDFPAPHGHPHHQHPLSRTHSLQHIPYDNYGQGPSVRYDSHGAMTSAGPTLPPSPNSAVDTFNPELPGGPGDRKRQRTGVLGVGGIGTVDEDGQSDAKRFSRARSDSAPLGYGFGQSWPHASRPRSGSSLAVRAPPGTAPRREELLVNISGTANRNVPSTSSSGQQQAPQATMLNVSPVTKSPSGP